MKNIEKFITKKNLAFANLGVGAIAGLFFLLSFTLNASSLSGAMFMIRILVILFFVYLLVVLVEAVAAGLLCFMKKERDLISYLFFGVSVAGFLIALFNFNTFRILGQVMSGNIFAAYALMDMGSLGLTLRLLQIMLVANVGFTIYTTILLFQNKLGGSVNHFDSASATSAVESVGAAASAATTTAAKASSEVVGSVKKFISTKAGKGVIVAIILVVVVAGGFGSYYAFFKKTTIDVFKNCKIEVTGKSGKGSASLKDCNIDYDQTNTDLYSFVSTVRYNIENNGSLKNGDNVVITAQYSEETAKSLKIRLKDTTMKKKISGLMETYEKYSKIPSKMKKEIDSVIEETVISKIKDSDYYKIDDNVNVVNKEIIHKMYVENRDSYYDLGGDVIYLYKVTAEGESDGAKVTQIQYYLGIVSDVNSQNKPEDNTRANRFYFYGDKTDEEIIDDVIESYEDYQIETMK